MPSSGKKTRAITLQGKRYVWSVRSAYLRQDTPHIGYLTKVRFAACLEGHKSTPLIIHFQT